MKKIILIFIFLIGITLLIYAHLIEPQQLGITKYILKDDNLKNIKIVFVSDLHIKPHQQKRLKEIVNLINEQNADIVLSAGDFVSGHTHIGTMNISNIAKELSKIKTKYGVFTTLGNHDKYYGVDLCTTALENNNIKVLNNSNTHININEKTIYIAGIQYKIKNQKLIDAALKDTKSPTIMITHSPDEYVKIPNNVNLILAGHTHGGQVLFPFIGAIFTASKYHKRFLYGLINEDNKKMIVTRGIGVSVLPFRFNCSPEIVVIEFI